MWSLLLCVQLFVTVLLKGPCQYIVELLLYVLVKGFTSKIKVVSEPSTPFHSIFNLLDESHLGKYS